MLASMIRFSWNRHGFWRSLEILVLYKNRIWNLIQWATSNSRSWMCLSLISQQHSLLLADYVVGHAWLCSALLFTCFLLCGGTEMESQEIMLAINCQNHPSIQELKLIFSLFWPTKTGIYVHMQNSQLCVLSLCRKDVNQIILNTKSSNWLWKT